MAQRVVGIARYDRCHRDFTVSWLLCDICEWVHEQLCNATHKRRMILWAFPTNRGRSYCQDYALCQYNLKTSVQPRTSSVAYAFESASTSHFRAPIGINLPIITHPVVMFRARKNTQTTTDPTRYIIGRFHGKRFIALFVYYLFGGCAIVTMCALAAAATRTLVSSRFNMASSCCTGSCCKSARKSSVRFYDFVVDARDSKSPSQSESVALLVESTLFTFVSSQLWSIAMMRRDGSYKW